MPDLISAVHRPPLRMIVLAATGQDIRHCKNCWRCDDVTIGDQDVTLGMLVQLILMDDDEVLTSRTLWSDDALRAAQRACANGLNLEAVMLALRDEVQRRGHVNDQKDIEA